MKQSLELSRHPVVEQLAMMLGTRMAISERVAGDSTVEHLQCQSNLFAKRMKMTQIK